jgi:ATP-dependent Clp protease ATP-binding subunit ClpA
MFEKFTEGARRAVVLSQEEARGLDHNYIGTEHLLIGLLAVEDEQDVAQRVLGARNFTADTAREALAGIVGRGQKPAPGHIPFTPRSKRVLELSAEESEALHNSHIGTEHILLGLVREGEGLAAKILVHSGIQLADLRAAVLTDVSAAVGAVAAVQRNRTPAATEILDRATALAEGAPVGSHHLLQALTGSPDSAAARVLADLGVDAETLAARVAALDLETTSDMTPLELALRRMRIFVDGEEAHVVFGDEQIVALARRAVAENGGAEVRVTDGAATRPRLLGAFAPLRQAAETGLGTAVHVLSEHGAGGEGSDDSVGDEGPR